MTSGSGLIEPGGELCDTGVCLGVCALQGQREQTKLRVLCFVRALFCCFKKGILLLFLAVFKRMLEEKTTKFRHKHFNIV